MVALKPRDFDRLVADPARARPRCWCRARSRASSPSAARALVDAANRGASDPFSAGAPRRRGGRRRSRPRCPTRAHDRAVRRPPQHLGARCRHARHRAGAGARCSTRPRRTRCGGEVGRPQEGHGSPQADRGPPSAAALACYADEAADIERIIDEIARRDGLRRSRRTPAPPSRTCSAPTAGRPAPRSRSSPSMPTGTGRVRLADVEAVIGEHRHRNPRFPPSTPPSPGAVADLDRTLSRACAGRHVVARHPVAALRQVHALSARPPSRRGRRGPAAAVERMVPPVFFRRKQVVPTPSACGRSPISTHGRRPHRGGDRRHPPQPPPSPTPSPERCC